MPDEPTTPEPITKESGIEEREEEFVEDIAERIDATLISLSERVTAIESALSELSSRFGGFDERFSSIDARFNATLPGGPPPDHGPTSDHFWFRPISRTYK